tara:strand:- start:1216 stop:2499 length:1284 start_codon:yes stop_codon:yes gene_type:complete
MKSVFLKKLAEQKAKKTTTKTITKEQFEKIRKAKKQTNDLAKKNNIEVGTGKYGVLSDKLNKSIGDKNLSEANKIMKDMKDFIKDVKDKPTQQTKKVRKGQFATIGEARQAAKDAGKKTFNFGGKVNIPVTKSKRMKGQFTELTKGMSKEEKAKFKNVRGNELRKLKMSQLKDMMSDKYGGGTSLGGVRVQKLTPEGEKLLKENKLSTIINAQKFIKFKTKSGKEKTVPSNKYIVEGIGSRDAPLVPKGAVPKTKEDKKAFREYFENEMDDSQRLEYILQRFEPQYTSSQLADILGITARDLTATIKAGSGKFKQFGVGDAELQALKDKFQVRSISKDMKTGGMVKYKSGTGKKTIGRRVKDYVKKSPIKSAMAGLGAYEAYDVGKYAMDTLGPIMGFKSGTKGKTIRGCGKAMRGFGKAMIKKGNK